MMRVLQVSGAKGWGGNEQQIIDLIYGFGELGVTNLLLCVPKSALHEKAEKFGLDYKLLSPKKGLYFKYAKSFNEVVEEFKPDVIHLHNSNSVTFSVIADMLYGINTPIVHSKKGIVVKKNQLSVFKYNHKSIKKVICVSEAVLRSFKSVLKPKNHHKLCVVYDGIKVGPSPKSNINLRETYGISKKVILVGNIATHTRAKDLVTLIETLNILVYDLGVTNIHVIQIGIKGKYSNKFLPLIEKYNLEKYITVTGFIENAVNLMDQMDIYLMTSEREGLPITIYEAFLKRIPVISTKAGGVPEAIEHDYNGLLAEVRDADTLAKHLKNLAVDKEKQQLFTERSNKLLFEKFTTSQCSSNTLKVYKEVLSGK